MKFFSYIFVYVYILNKGILKFIETQPIIFNLDIVGWVSKNFNIPIYTYTNI